MNYIQQINKILSISKLFLISSLFFGSIIWCQTLTVTLTTPCNFVSPCKTIGYIATATGGVPPYRFIWFDNLIATSNTGITTRDFASNQAISVTVVDATGETATAKAHSAFTKTVSKKYCS